MGKSTSAQILGRDNGYVYYEADTFGLMKNPFVNLNADNPTIAQFSQKKLKGVHGILIESPRALQCFLIFTYLIVVNF